MILSGPSGVGKDTVIDAWQEIDPDVVRVVAGTTRFPRPGEKDGVDYHFLSEEEFIQMVEDGGFLEHKEVHGKLYGTPAQSVEELLRAGKTALLKIDVQGALAVMQVRPEVVSVMLVPPSWEELEARIRGRKTETEDQIQVRLGNARWELDQAHLYQHRVVNQKVEVAVSELMRIKEESWQISS
jgi:guanylate kinase